MWKRLILTVLCFFVLSTSVVRAQTTPTESPPATIIPVNDIYGYKFTEQEIREYKRAVENCDTPSLECLVRYTTRFAAMEWALDIMVGQGATATGGDEATNLQGADTGSGGIFAGVMGIVDSMYRNPAAHTGTYVADVMHTAGFAPKAYAQGLGFASLDPILNLWKVFRNVAYFFFIIIFIVLGFMIMLRQKISGQAAVTAQQAIPSVIISLILVTFSYAIAGFMIDLMYVVMFLIVGLFEGITTGIDFPGGSSELTGGNLIDLNILGLVSFMFRANISDAGTNIDIVSQVLDAAAGENIGTYLGGIIGGLTLTLVITVAVLIGAVRLFFELLKSYAAIILYVVASPLILMFGALPGNIVFSKWIMGIIGNLLAFPTVLLMLIIYVEFTKGNYTGGATAGFMPPFLLGTGAGDTVNMIGPLLGLAIILALPDIVKKVKEAAGAGDGGLGSLLLGWAGTNLSRGEVAIPAAMGGAGYLPGGLRAVQQDWSRDGTRSPRALWRTFRKGYYDKVNDSYVGGANRWAGSGWDRGLAIRRNLDRMKEGRFWEAEDLEKTLSRIAEQQRGGGNDKGGKGGAPTSPPAGEPPP